ncbi:hypothetical protein ACD591_17845 [Rufibacter glacialis]|uniref:Uncharacterized protein n=1 Tax=Rufibacter glacialis TaxID=1259555 RepID=A0A5M8Q499_9BACT|nr:hypothetical protein [Rufibacter glacialis]KAA6430707.1 hypothetical protein FOE74_19765 [Rufibacter glacialis]GGK86006.1 hypothetical protein GCM10011405_37280 [Rufibacter glacialis]
MNHNILRVSSEPKVIGVNNGIYQIELDKSCFSDYKELERFKLGFPEDSTIDLNYPQPLIYKVLKKAKLTDFMGYSQYLKGVPFVLSGKAVNVFKEFSLKEHSLIEITLRENQDVCYYLFRYPFTENSKINFEESVFYTQIPGQDKVYHKIHDEDEFRAFWKQNALWKAEKFVLDEAEAKYDCIRLRIGGVFISERLQKAIETSNLIGQNIPRTNAPFITFS